MGQRNRKRLWINGDIQGAVLRRCLFYWLGCVIFLTVPLLLGHLFSEPNKLFFEHFGRLFARFWPIYLGLVALLPFILLDAVRFTNRIAGPIYRIQTQMSEVLAGNEAESVRFRQDDFWQDLADQFNQVADLLKRQKPSNRASAESTPNNSAKASDHVGSVEL